jgi:hypothetical protein
MRISIRSLVLVPSLVATFVVGVGCGGQLADCEAIARDEEACMPQSAIDDCEAANDDCAESGEVLTLESCPLQFTCSAPAGSL